MCLFTFHFPSMYFGLGQHFSFKYHEKMIGFGCEFFSKIHKIHYMQKFVHYKGKLLLGYSSLPCSF